MGRRLIRIGVILGAHGVRGAARLASLTENPEDIFVYKPLTDESGGRVFEIEKRGIGKDCFLVSIKGVQTREAAQALKGMGLFIERSLLPAEEEGEYYLADLIGLEAWDESGKPVGKVEATHDYGAGLFLEIKPPHRESFMLPFKDAFVPRVDIAAGTMTVLLPEGWLEEEKREERKK